MSSLIAYGQKGMNEEVIIKSKNADRLTNLLFVLEGGK
jgi:hypothetical protein